MATGGAARADGGGLCRRAGRRLARPGRFPEPRPAAGAGLRQGAGRALQPHFGPAQDDPWLRPGRGALLSCPHVRGRRGPDVHRATFDPLCRSRISGWPIRRRCRRRVAARDAYNMLGSPEGELALAQAAVYLATAPKSNSVYTAFKSALSLAKSSGSPMPPMAISNAPDQADGRRRLRRRLCLRSRHARRLFGPAIFPGSALTAAFL